MPDEKSLADHTKQELKELAEAHEVPDFPGSGSKTEMIEALAAAGVGPPPEKVYRLRLNESADGFGAFMAGGRSIELHDDEVFETTNRHEYNGARDLPFLEDAD